MLLVLLLVFPYAANCLFRHTLERLWCVWEELFTLFTLQQRAAGTGERISIVCMDYSTGLNFSYVIKQFDTIYQRILAIRYSSEKPVLVDDIDSRLLGGFADENRA